MTKLLGIARLKIHPGKISEFKDLAAQCLLAVKEKDKHTNQYDWFLNEEQSECVVHEIYSDSNAVFEHLTNLGDLFGKVLQVADFSIEIFGNPSEELRKALAPMNAKIYSLFQGL